MASVDDIEELIATRKLNGIDDGLYTENIEDLKKELEQKNKEFDNYLETHKDYLSDEAEAIRKDIHRLMNKIALLEKSTTKNADKMFEELGYKNIQMNVINLLFEYAKEDLQERISFYASEEVAKTFKYKNNSSQITMQELKAINKKCEELGWI